MKITNIQIIPLKFPTSSRKHLIHSVNPTHRFEDLKYNAPLKKRKDIFDTIVLKIETDEGVFGLSASSYAVQGAYPILEHILKPALVGEDALRTDWLWEKMFSICIGQGREGICSNAISLIDTALWDLKGKAFNQPVYNLLGGKTKKKIRVYVSHLYVYATTQGDPDLSLLREEAAMYVEQGFTAVKQRLGFGPWEGIKGMKKNYSVVQAVRESIGQEIEQMIDGTRSLDANYAIQMSRMVEEFNLSWFEEPVQPHDWEGYVKVRKAVSMPISGGENEFSKHSFAKWLALGCADIWQPDVDRCGGITEVKKIVHMAEANNIQVIPHGGWMTNFHVVMSSMACPMAEFFPHPYPITQILIGHPTAKEGYIELGDKPGFGLELNEDALKQYRWEG